MQQKNPVIVCLCLRQRGGKGGPAATAVAEGRERWASGLDWYPVVMRPVLF